MGISRRTLYRVISKSEIAISKIGAKTFIKRPDIDKFFERLYESGKNKEAVQELNAAIQFLKYRRNCIFLLRLYTAYC